MYHIQSYYTYVHVYTIQYRFGVICSAVKPPGMLTYLPEKTNLPQN